MGAVSSTEVHDFTGGLATVQAPHLIASNEAQEFVNVDITVGSLASVPKLGNVEVLSGGPNFFKYNGIVHSFDTYRSNVRWYNRWYWSDGLETKKMLEDGKVKNLGLPTPETELTTIEGYLHRPHTGTYVYTYTFYDRDTDAESAPAPLSEPLSLTDNSIIVSGFEELPKDATHYRLYRVGGFLPSFTMVTELTTDNLPNFQDDLDETQIDGRLLTTLYTGPPPNGLNYLVELNGRMYGAVGNLIYWADLGNPDSWYVSNFIKFASTITALSVSQSGLIVNTIDQTHILRGRDITDFTLKRLSDQVGCSDFRSVAQIGKSSIWYDSGQWILCDGYTVKLLTFDKVAAPSNIAALGAVVLNNIYYMLFGPALYPGEELYPDPKLYPNDPLGEEPPESAGTVVIDFKRGRGYSFGVHRHEGTLGIGLIDNVLHYGRKNEVVIPPIDNGACGEPFGECAHVYNCADIPGTDTLEPTDPIDLSIYTLTTADYDEGLEELIYESPMFIEGSRTNLKQYEKLRILYKGEFRVTVELENGDIIIDDMIRSINPNTDTYALLGVPKRNNHSYSVTIRIVGKGIVDSVQRTWKPRELV